jgi:6-pyruvoyltetrahydropterin/6-carboxytetrahydropterin synthase
LKASHGLLNYRGANEPIHEHDWLIEVKLAARDLGQSGIAVDFTEVDNLLDKIIVPFKDQELNKFEPFNELSPSAENFAKYIYDKLNPALDPQAALVSVSVWEDDCHGVLYKP